jgi:type IV secretion system protein VirD4
VTFYSLASLFVYQHYVALTGTADERGGRLKIRVNFILDEFGNFTEIPAFSNLLTVGGGRGMRFNLFVQSISQIEHKYGREQTQTILDNCHAWIYLKTANVETASQIAKKLGQYTTSSYSRSSSYNSSGTSSGNVSNSMNLIARPLLTEDEILRIERPYALVMLAGQYPAIMRLPDISEWQFNLALGLGDEEHNRKLRAMREKAREARAPTPIELWGIWERYGKKKRPASDFGEQGGQDDTEAEREYAGEDGMRSLPPRNVERVYLGHAARAGREIDDMFTQFKRANGLRPKRVMTDLERIERL